MISRNRHRIGLLVALATASCGLSPAIAQQGRQQDENPPARFDVDFPGGTLSDYVDAVRKASPDGVANIVVMPEAKGLGVPPIKLVAVTVEAAIQILQGSYTTADDRRAEVSVKIYPIGDSSDLVMKVVAKVESKLFFSSVWSVEEALAHGQTAEELLEAVEAARSLFSKKAEISYHPPTGLLIVRGTREQTDLIHDVLEQLIRGAERRNMEMDSIRRNINELKVDQHRVDAEMRISQKEAEGAEVFLDQMMKRLELHQVSQEVVAQADLQNMRAETELMMREQESHRIGVRLKTLRKALKRYESQRE